MEKSKMSKELEAQVKEIKRLSREQEIASGINRASAAGPMKDKKKEASKYAARKKNKDYYER